MINENWLKVAITAMALGIGLYIIPLGMIANPEILELSTNLSGALLAFVQIAIGLSLISYGLIGFKQFLYKLLLLIAGVMVIFGHLFV
jgi:TRAP-type uncharacterized transport system fused permease subunit